MIESDAIQGKRPTMRCAAVAAALAMILAAAGAVMAADPAEVPLVIEKNRFEPDVINVKAGAPFVLVITNKDKGPEEFEMAQPRIEKVIPAGKTIRLKMPALKPGKYPIEGEYHPATAKGTIVAE